MTLQIYYSEEILVLHPFDVHFFRQGVRQVVHSQLVSLKTVKIECNFLTYLYISLTCIEETHLNIRFAYRIYLIILRQIKQKMIKTGNILTHEPSDISVNNNLMNTNVFNIFFLILNKHAKRKILYFTICVKLVSCWVVSFRIRLMFSSSPQTSILSMTTFSFTAVGFPSLILYLNSD